ncbi:MAG: GH116 family glycosyl-hydrolase [Christensenellales bacterium]|jgi:non-lysosomal glucosylceramidase
MKKYTNAMRYADFPIGGIGTGTVTLSAAGRLKDFQFFNRPSLDEKVPFTFFAMHTSWQGKTDTCAIEAPPAPDFYKGRGYHPKHTAGLPKFASSEMTVRYPFAEIAFADEAFPIKVSLRAFNPFIPMNEDDSGIPAALFRFTMTNTSDAPAEVLVASSMTNIHNYHTQDAFDNPFSTPNAWNERRGNGIFMTGNAVGEDDLCYSNCAILTPDANAEVRPLWYQGGWYDGITDFWNNLREGRLEVDAPVEDDFRRAVGLEPVKTGSVGVRKTIAAGKTETFTFVMSWYVPNRPKGWTIEQSGGKTMKNYYATRYKDAWDAGENLLKRLAYLEDASERFADALYDTTLPAPILDAISANIAVLRSTTCWRAPNGTFTCWEGSHEQVGSCHGTCTHVWNYAQTAAYLFPRLEQSARENEFLTETNPDGKMTFRTQRGFDLPDWGMYPAVDGQLGAIMRAWREWKLGGDRAYLERVYPHVLRAFDFARAEFDPDGDGVPEARQHNTYDIEFYGQNPLSGVFMLGAAKAVAAMAWEIGDEKRAEETEAFFTMAQANFDAMCWNGTYYIQRIDDVDAYPYQFGTGCLSDQLLGQTLASLFGLGRLLPKERIRSAIKAVYDNNFLDGARRNPCVQRLFVSDDEPALVLCTWPKGDMPRFPFVYSDEVWTGIEYQVATLLLYEGFEEEAIALVRAVRDRFDGERRAPFNEMECGFYYARAMASTAYA